MTPRVRSIVIVLISVTWLSVFAQSAAVPDDEDAAVEKYATEGSFQFRTNLHARSGSFEDGAKGKHITVSRGEPPMLWMPDGSFETGAMALLHGDACRAAAIVVAKDVGSSTYITHSKAFIYAKHNFVVQRILKAPQGIVVGSNIQVIQPGGSLVDDGEQVRLAFDGLVPFSTGHTYLLVLLHRQDAAPTIFVPKRYSETVRVISGHVSIPKGEILSPAAEGAFVPGETITDFSNSLASSTNNAPCTR